MTDSTRGDAGNRNALSATYQSAANQGFSFSSSLPAISSAAVETRTKYLKDLRQAVLWIQEQVNKELTARMEEDNGRAAGTPSGQPRAAGVDEAKEEENYGEEVPEEDG